MAAGAVTEIFGALTARMISGAGLSLVAGGDAAARAELAAALEAWSGENLLSGRLSKYAPGRGDVAPWLCLAYGLQPFEKEPAEERVKAFLAANVAEGKRCALIVDAADKLNREDLRQLALLAEGVHLIFIGDERVKAVAASGRESGALPEPGFSSVLRAASDAADAPEAAAEAPKPAAPKPRQGRVDAFAMIAGAGERQKSAAPAETPVKADAPAAESEAAPAERKAAAPESAAAAEQAKPAPAPEAPRFDEPLYDVSEFAAGQQPERRKRKRRSRLGSLLLGMAAAIALTGGLAALLILS